ncbi:hypothetical protein Ciccas_008537 [Cichlidogyrus casuarinus]|uniref:Uncharacterized protein n=1 Tax=Cichlidogyrus casuarinus TaxID=1844966 RepID=A0ABD2Q070_9PLAT
MFARNDRHFDLIDCPLTTIATSENFDPLNWPYPIQKFRAISAQNADIGNNLLGNIFEAGPISPLVNRSLHLMFADEFGNKDSIVKSFHVQRPCSIPLRLYRSSQNENQEECQMPVLLSEQDLQSKYIFSVTDSNSQEIPISVIIKSAQGMDREAPVVEIKMRPLIVGLYKILVNEPNFSTSAEDEYLGCYAFDPNLVFVNPFSNTLAWHEEITVEVDCTAGGVADLHATLELVNFDPELERNQELWKQELMPELGTFTRARNSISNKLMINNTRGSFLNEKFNKNVFKICPSKQVRKQTMSDSDDDESLPDLDQFGGKKVFVLRITFGGYPINGCPFMIGIRSKSLFAETFSSKLLKEASMATSRVKLLSQGIVTCLIGEVKTVYVSIKDTPSSPVTVTMSTLDDLLFVDLMDEEQQGVSMTTELSYGLVPGQKNLYYIDLTFTKIGTHILSVFWNGHPVAFSPATVHALNLDQIACFGVETRNNIISHREDIATEFLFQRVILVDKCQMMENLIFDTRKVGSGIISAFYMQITKVPHTKFTLQQQAKANQQFRQMVYEQSRSNRVWIVSAT